jgi:hypothetical protein
MQGLWYGDRRDRVKWGALAYLARRFELASIFQIAYFRQHQLGSLATDEGEKEIPPEILQHFSDLNMAKRLAEHLGVAIGVFEDPFDPKNRDAYLASALSAADSLKRRRLLFLDPDTGVEPQALQGEHASLKEIASFWGSLSQGEVLAVYQHAARMPGWDLESAKRLATVCSSGEVRAIKSDVARDVAILWAEKV